MPSTTQESQRKDRILERCHIGAHGNKPELVGIRRQDILKLLDAAYQKLR